MIDLSVIIPSYNTKEITLTCLDALENALEKSQSTWEIIVIDNSSTDGSVKSLIDYQKTGLKNKKDMKLILNKKNYGYSKANNQGIRIAAGKYILLLNSDVIIDDVNFDQIVEHMEIDNKIGALTVEVKLNNGSIDPASHRGFPTIWRSICYFTKLEKIFGRIQGLKRLFGGYHLLGSDMQKIHEIDSPSGAFFLTKKSILDRLNGFDEEFFMYGEDLDLAFRIKLLGYKVIYYPRFKVKHLKYQSGLKNTEEIKAKTRYHFFNAMKIFYKKHYQKTYPFLINWLVYLFINLKIDKTYEENRN